MRRPTLSGKGVAVVIEHVVIESESELWPIVFIISHQHRCIFTSNKCIVGGDRPLHKVETVYTDGCISEEDWYEAWIQYTGMPGMGHQSDRD